MIDVEKKLWARVGKYGRLLQMVPFLDMAAVCNNLAFGVVDDKSDIDLFLVAKSGRLFIMRSFVTALLHICGVRRHGDLIAERFCLSFFVDGGSLDLRNIAIDNDVYLAYWIKSMLPIVESKKGFVDKVLNSNLWAADFFENTEDFVINRERVLKLNWFYRAVRVLLEFAFGGRLGDFIERSLMKWQVKRAMAKAEMASDEASIVISESILKFHNVDRRRKYRRCWFDNYGEEKLTDEKFRSMKSLY